MIYTAGHRARLVKDNLFNFVESGLTDLGWFDAGRQHSPLRMLADAEPWDEEIRPNLVAISTEGVTDNDLELGSMLAEHHWAYFIDLIAETESLGLHLATDVRDMLQGRITTLTLVGPYVPVYDLSVQSATPNLITTVEISDVSMDKGRIYTKQQKKSWWQVGFTVIDDYGTDDD